MAAKFIAEEGELKGLTLSMEEGEQWVIGRDPDVCQLLIEDSSTSRKHLICRTSPEGIILENLSDTNPVLVNDTEVTEPLLLKNGDAVKIGNGMFRFYTEEAPQEVEELEAEEVPESEEVEEEPVVEAEEEAVEEEEPHVETPEEELEIFSEEEPEHETIYEEVSEEDKGILAEIDFDLKETGRWLLKVIGGPNNGAEFTMQTGNSYVIGTDPTSCDVVFHDTSVSRQHARITISETDTLTIEDLKSRNGTLIDGETVEGRIPLESNALVTMGTTSFLVFDREGDMQTIISPLLPSIVKVLQSEEEKKRAEEAAELAAEELAKISEGAELEKPEEKVQNALGAFILIGIITGLFVIVGIGTTTLFQSEPVQIKEQVNYAAGLDRALSPFPTVIRSYNNNTGRLLLVGHVLTLSDKNQILYNLQGLDFIRRIDHRGLIIDELVWRETNQILARDPKWKGISVHSPTAGTFVLSGYLQSRKQAEDLSDYITANFPYLDLLDRQIIVEEDVITSVEIQLDNVRIQNLSIQINNGELTLSGGLSKEQIVTLDRLVRQFREIPGIRNVKTFINELEAEQTMINITDRYTVSGFSHQDGVNLNVIINGRILTRGDVLDGRTITNIRSTAIFLEKDGVKYRIDYNQ
ncbi:MAG: hypothetical protein K940chlam7_01059 [Chlamydiae bacterium]|nr:hypothetical protein [Chlamydiota bacterium]